MIPQTFVDVGIAMILVGSVFLVMFAYAGNWPPLVVVESRSMQHSETESQIGIMDTGDLTMVKTVSSVGDIKSYVAGMQEGYSTYGDYGDVVIYWRAGDHSKTPIIHRAVIYLVANDNGSYSAPELKNLAVGADYTLTLPNNTWQYITGDIRLHAYGYRGMELRVPTSDMLGYMHTHGIVPTDGFITKGDFNWAVDQELFKSYIPVKFEWIHGVATGEIPWFGVMKLYLTGTLPSDTPSNSILYMWASIGVIVAIPISSEAYIWWRERRSGPSDGGKEAPPEAKAENPVAPSENIEAPSVDAQTEEKK
jgi:signal peptidase I